MALECDNTLKLPSELGMMTARKLSAELADRRGARLELDAAGVTFLGGLCLQILIAARRAWAADNVAFEIGNPSEHFLKDVRHLGAAGHLGIAEEDGPCP